MLHLEYTLAFLCHVATNLVAKKLSGTMWHNVFPEALNSNVYL